MKNPTRLNPKENKLSGDRQSWLKEGIRLRFARPITSRYKFRGIGIFN